MVSHGGDSDQWRPAVSLERLKARAALLDRVRWFFRERGLLEVETPVLSAAAVTDPNLDSLVADYRGPGAPPEGRLYMQTSPEFPMKRLLAAGSGPIWQVCHVFRGGERGPRHNPEFTMLEWYRPGWDHHQLMDEVSELVAFVCGERPVRRRTYAELFRPFALDPHGASAEECAAAARRLGFQPPDGLDRDGVLDLILSHAVTPELGRGVVEFVHEFPASQAALARICPGSPPVAERFECFLEGMEIANGFHELGDAEEQAARFRHDLEVRASRGLRQPPVDQRLLQALASGLPSCAGVAVGLDRLFMVALGAGHIDEVLPFPLERA